MVTTESPQARPAAGVIPAANVDSIEISGSFLARLAPDHVALAGFATYVLVTAVAPLEPAFDINLHALTYVALCYIAFLCGGLVCRTIDPPTKLPPRTHVPALSPIGFWLVMGLAVTGIGLRVVDRFIVRGVPFGDDFSAVREQLQSTEASLLSAAGAVLYPAAFVALFAYHLLPRRRRSILLATAAYVVFLYPALEAGLQGSRSLLLISFGFILMSRQLLPDSFGAFRHPWIFAAGASVLVYLLFLIFETRLEAAGADVVTSSTLSGFAFTLPPAKWIEDLMIAGDPPFRLAAAIVVHFTQYYCHSGYELMYVFDGLPEEHLFGAYNFFHVVKLWGLLTGDMSLIQRVSSVDIRAGVFATFFVPLFVDFGWLGVLVMAAFGYVCTALWLATRRRTVVLFPLHAYLTIVVFLMPVTSFIVAAQGLYTIGALSLIAVALTVLEGGRPAARSPRTTDR